MPPLVLFSLFEGGDLCLLRGEVLHALGNARAMRAAVDECEARFGDGAAAADALPNATLAAVRLKFGRFYLQSGEPRAAIAALRGALARRGAYPEALADLASAHLMLARAPRDEHFATAERALAAALELNPRDEQVRAQLEQLRASAAPSPPPRKKKKKRKP